MCGGCPPGRDLLSLASCPSVGSLYQGVQPAPIRGLSEEHSDLRASCGLCPPAPAGHPHCPRPLHASLHRRGLGQLICLTLLNAVSYFGSAEDQQKVEAVY